MMLCSIESLSLGTTLVSTLSTFWTFDTPIHEVQEVEWDDECGAVPAVGRDLLRTQVEREADWHHGSGSARNTAININERNAHQINPWPTQMFHKTKQSKKKNIFLINVWLTW